MSKGTDIFLSHNWGTDSLGRDNHARVGRVSEALESRGYDTWYDSDDMYGSIPQRMAEGIDNTKLVLVFVTSKYRDKVFKRISFFVYITSKYKLFLAVFFYYRINR